jgi:RES domain-containing protein
VITQIDIPDQVNISEVSSAILPADWNIPGTPHYTTQAIGSRWIRSSDSAVLRVPSAVIPEELNYVLNVTHTDFSHIVFSSSQPFHFDPRLK